MLALALALGVSSCSLMFSQQWERDPGAPTFTLRGDTSLTSGRPCVPNVDRALQGLPRTGRRLAFDPGSTGRLGGWKRHWQGIQRLSRDSITVLYVSRSGGDRSVIVVQVGKGPAERLHPDRETAVEPMRGVTVGTLPYDTGFRHAGGLALLGDLLLVPLDGAPGGRVVFYDVSAPLAPRRIGALRPAPSRDQRKPREASAVGLTRLADGHYLLVIGVHSSKALDFYLSGDTGAVADAAGYRRLGVLTGLNVTGLQSLALLTQCDGTVFLVGTHNTAVPPPSRGRDHLHWYRLEPERPGRIALREQGERWIVCTACNLAAAAGLYLAPGGAMVLYASEFWTHGPEGRVAVEEFWP